MEVQIKLLRTLQEREFERVGGTETLKVDVRVVSATNRDLETMISDGKFREDLYYRLNVFPIHLPPLRDRIDDLPRLVEHFIAKFTRTAGKAVRGISGEAIAMMQSYSWPGNVRELENVVERAIIVARGPEITGADLDFGKRGTGGQMPPGAPTATPPGGIAATAPIAGLGAAGAAGTSISKPLTARLLDEEKREIMAAIDRCGGNIAGAARTLGVNRSTLYYRLRKHGLEHLLPNKVVGPGEGAPADE
jgi:two-component system response regulator AtoC